MRYVLAVLALLVASTASAGDYYRRSPYTPNYQPRYTYPSAYRNYSYRPQRSYYGESYKSRGGYRSWSITPEPSVESLYRNNLRAMRGWND